MDWRQLRGSGRSGRIVERDVRAVAATDHPASETRAPSKLRISPVAQRMAETAGIDLAEVAAQNPGVRIDRAEVAAAIAARTSVTSARSAGEGQAEDRAGEVTERVAVTRIRRLLAQRMTDSAHTTAAVTLTTEADATTFVALREQIKTDFTPRGLLVPTYNDLLIKLTAVALQEHRLLNAIWQGEEIVIPAAVHMGLAVDMPEGLMVPVVRNAQSKSVGQIAAETRLLVEKVRAHQVSPDELQGGTFTITNLGVYGIDAFTPLINLPQCGILGVGRIISKPAVYDGQVVPRQMMALSLTFDHRVVDGAPAARFLQTVSQFIETPMLWLVV